MKKYIVPALVIIVFSVGKLCYSYATRITQDQVVKYMDEIDGVVTVLNNEMRAATSDITSSTFEPEEGNMLIKKIQDRFKSCKNSISTVKAPKESPLFLNLKEEALLMIDAENKAATEVWTEITNELKPKLPTLEIDHVKQLFTGQIVFKNQEAYDSIQHLIFDRQIKLDERIRNASANYNAARSALHSAYKIIDLRKLPDPASFQ
ncbi:MAG: hypothetical protein V4506_09005 [Bacteroidota bacterium]